MTNWTRPPWDKRGNYILGPHPKGGDRKRKICEVIHAEGTYSDESIANARLIKSAPILYAALNKLTKAAEDVDQGYLDSAVDMANEALAEAKK